jgi:putative oxidoreductase
MNSKRWFITGSLLSFLIAALHIVIIFIGAEGYRYFGAGEEMATMANAGSPIPALVTAGITIIFVLFGFYALSGARLIKKLVWLKFMLTLITGIYLLRGLGFFIEVLGIIYQYEVPVRHAVFSLVSLITGLIHLIGLRKVWKEI